MASAIPQTDRHTHPCFYAGAKGRHGRIHLPVAPSCNIQCAYCRRDYDCPNENRPGVTGSVIDPEGAANLFESALERTPHISVAAVAGPGDAFCTPEITLQTFEQIRRKSSDIALCVSTNGLNVKGYIPQLCDLKVGFVTITVNALNPDIGTRLYNRVNFGSRIICGVEAARILISRQLEAISLLKAAGIVVKVNTVVVPGVNEDHVMFVAKQMGCLGVDLMNLLPLIPLAGTEMENMTGPSEDKMRKLRQKASSHVSQMRHCRRCRSDSIGLLYKDFARNLGRQR